MGLACLRQSLMKVNSFVDVHEQLKGLHQNSCKNNLPEDNTDIRSGGLANEHDQLVIQKLLKDLPFLLILFQSPAGGQMRVSSNTDIHTGV